MKPLNVISSLALLCLMSCTDNTTQPVTITETTAEKAAFLKGIKCHRLITKSVPDASKANNPFTGGERTILVVAPTGAEIPKNLKFNDLVTSQKTLPPPFYENHYFAILKEGKILMVVGIEGDLEARDTVVFAEFEKKDGTIDIGDRVYAKNAEWKKFLGSLLPKQDQK